MNTTELTISEKITNILLAKPIYVKPGVSQKELDEVGLIHKQSSLEELLAQELATQKKEILDRVEKEVIGVDDKQVRGKTMDDFKYPWAKNRNDLRQRQRKLLTEMRKG
jgi:hypothetical protein